MRGARGRGAGHTAPSPPSPRPSAFCRPITQQARPGQRPGSCGPGTVLGVGKGSPHPSAVHAGQPPPLHPLWARLTGRTPSRTAVSRPLGLAGPSRPWTGPRAVRPFCPLGTRASERGWPKELGRGSWIPARCPRAAPAPARAGSEAQLTLLCPPCGPRGFSGTGLLSRAADPTPHPRARELSSHRSLSSELSLPPLQGQAFWRRPGWEGAGRWPGGGEVTSHPHTRGIASELTVAAEDGRLGSHTPAPAWTLTPSAHFRAPTVTVSMVTQTEGPGSWHWASREVLLTAPPKPSHEGFRWSCDPNHLT